MENCSLYFLVAHIALNLSHSLSIWFKNLLQALWPSSESRSYFSSGLYFKWSLIMTVFSSKRKSLLLLNSSISVNGRGGAVDALIGISFGNSNSSSSLVYWPFLIFLPCISLQFITFKSQYNVQKKDNKGYENSIVSVGD